MKAITIRQNGILICFGPDNGMYEPSLSTPGIKAIEPSYETVIEEWLAMPKPIDPRQNAKNLLGQAKTLPELIAALKDLL